MEHIRLTGPEQERYVSIPITFIQNHMILANGDYVKLYLWLSKLLQDGLETLSIHGIAEALNLTESDINRALKYWESVHLIQIDWDNERISGIQLKPLISTPRTIDRVVDQSVDTAQVQPPKDIVSFKSAPQYSTEKLTTLAKESGYDQLLFVAKSYLGKDLFEKDLATIISFHDWLKLPFEVIELLFEYCVSNNHRSLRYIETVAINWAEEEVDTVEKAKYRMETYNKTFFTIFKALGIANRQPVASEVTVMSAWLEKFDLELVLEACDRTIKQTGQGSLKYVNKILEEWQKAHVKTFEDIEGLDRQFKTQSKSSPSPKETSTNRFINHPQRVYDFDQLEKKAMEKRLNQS